MADFLEELGKLIGPIANHPNTGVAPVLQIDPLANQIPQGAGRLSAPRSPLEGRVIQAITQAVGRSDSMRLHQLRKALADIPREQLDAAMLSLHNQRAVTLMPLDNPPDIKAVGDAALKKGATTYHTIALDKP